MSKTDKKIITLISKLSSKYNVEPLPNIYVEGAKKKLDPKAEVRNRGTVCVPASSAKDKQDHFPINSIDQARNALARVHQYDKAPSWYSGSLKSLQELVSRKVHAKYPSIGKDKNSKKSFNVEKLIEKYGQSFLPVIKKYQLGAPHVASRGSEMLSDIMETMKINAYHFWENSEQTEKDQRVRDILLQQAELFGKIAPEMDALDSSLDNIDGSAAMVVM